MTSVKASEAVPRLAPNSVCTTGSATTTDHMPTLPSEPISTATASRIHARRESGTNRSESRVSSEEISTARAISEAYCLKVKPHCRDIGHADVVGFGVTPVIPGWCEAPWRHLALISGCLPQRFAMVPIRV